MRLLLLLLLLASSASAQTGASSLPVRVLVGTSVAAAVPALLYAAQEGAGYVGLAAAPFVAAVAVHSIGTDGSGSSGRTLGGALLGALPGVVLYSAQVAQACGDDGCFIPIPPLPTTEAAVLYVVGSAVGAALRYRGGTHIEPVTFTMPDGERAAGLLLRASF